MAISHRTAGLFFLVIGIALIVLLVIWIATTFISPQPMEPPELTGPSVRATDSQMPVKEIEAAIEAGKVLMLQHYQTSNAYRWWSQFVDWIGFALSSFITVLVGATGTLLSPKDDPLAAAQSVAAKGTFGTSRWILITIGTMAALASVAIGMSNRLGAASQSSIQHADQVRTAIAAARQKFNEAGSPTDAHQVIDELQAEISKRS